MDLSAEELRAIVARGEGRTVEFKRGLPAPARVARTLCAFANTRGGLLLVGVTDRGRVVGAARPRAVVAELRRVARELVAPPLEPAFASVAVGDARVVACSVPLSPTRPHAVAPPDRPSEVVVRAGSSNRRATGATLAAIGRPRRTSGLGPLERAVLDFVRATPGATVARFARAANVGAQRARRAFVALEREGLLVAHGEGRGRTYACA